MDNAKDIFLRDKELSGKWSGWTHGPDAARVFATADSQLLDWPELTQEQMRGAKIYRSILMTLADVDDSESTIPTSGLNHDIDPKSRSKKITVSNKKA